MPQQLSFLDQSKETWIKVARENAKLIAKQQGEVCADDIHRTLPIPSYIDKRNMGHVFKGLEFVRFKKSIRTECHHRTIAVFRLKDQVS
jgi:hypothetical protein